MPRIMNEKIAKINETLAQFFNDPSNPKQILAKDLMPLLVKNGIFPSDHRKGLPIRNLLRKLDTRNALSQIPYVVAVRKKCNTNWYFSDMATRQSHPIISSDSPKTSTKKSVLRKRRQRQYSDEYYIIGLCNEVLGQVAVQQYKFEFLNGDSGRPLPVDAYYSQLNLVVEYHERQHAEEVPFFDRRETVSGVSRGEQRSVYDQRRRDILLQHQIHLVEMYYSDFGTSKRLKRDREHDLEIIKKKLARFI